MLPAEHHMTGKQIWQQAGEECVTVGSPNQSQKGANIRLTLITMSWNTIPIGDNFAFSLLDV